MSQSSNFYTTKQYIMSSRDPFGLQEHTLSKDVNVLLR